MSYISFQNKWLGKRVDFDGLYGYQCVDLIKQYMKEHVDMPNGAYGNAIDYWYRTHKAVIAKYDRIEGSSAQAGDIVVMKGNSGNPYGHIAIASGSINPITVQILEQNGSTGNGRGLGGDAIRLRHVPRYRVAGLLRLKQSDTPQYYTVISGDTVSRICRQFGITISKFQALNPSIKNINLIYKGQKVRIK
jgi:hypothetical protein